MLRKILRENSGIASPHNSEGEAIPSSQFAKTQSARLFGLTATMRNTHAKNIGSGPWWMGPMNLGNREDQPESKKDSGRKAIL